MSLITWTIWNVRAIPSLQILWALRGRDVLSAEEDLPRVGPVEPRDAVEEGALPRAVGPDDAQDLALVHGEGDVLGRGQPAEPLRDPLDLEKGGRGHFALLPIEVSNPQTPCGWYAEISMMSAP